MSIINCNDEPVKTLLNSLSIDDLLAAGKKHRLVLRGSDSELNHRVLKEFFAELGLTPTLNKNESVVNNFYEETEFLKRDISTYSKCMTWSWDCATSVFSITYVAGDNLSGLPVAHSNWDFWKLRWDVELDTNNARVREYFVPLFLTRRLRESLTQLAMEQLEYEDRIAYANRVANRMNLLLGDRS